MRPHVLSPTGGFRHNFGEFQLRASILVFLVFGQVLLTGLLCSFYKAPVFTYAIVAVTTILVVALAKMLGPQIRMMQVDPVADGLLASVVADLLALEELLQMIELREEISPFEFDTCLRMSHSAEVQLRKLASRKPRTIPSENLTSAVAEALALKSNIDQIGNGEELCELALLAINNVEALLHHICNGESARRLAGNRRHDT